MGLCLWWAAGRECSSMLFPVKTITAFHSGHNSVTQFINLIGYGMELRRVMVSTFCLLSCKPYTRDFCNVP